jgi:hypothetical protein
MALINDDVRSAIKAFCKALPPLAKPDGMYGRTTSYLQDCADRAFAQTDSPLNSEWFQKLLTHGTADDLVALCDAFKETDTDAAANVKYHFMQRILIGAHERDQAGKEVSVEIPAWYEASGWWRAVPWPTGLWNCELRLLPAVAEPASAAAEPTS